MASVEGVPGLELGPVQAVYVDLHNERSIHLTEPAKGDARFKVFIVMTVVCVLKVCMHGNEVLQLGGIRPSAVQIRSMLPALL